MAMKKCKECGADISSSAKRCPQCGKKQKKAGLIVILLVLVAIIAIVAGGNNTNTSIEQKQIKKVGETVETQYFKVTVDSLKTLKGTTYNEPSKGNEFVQVNLTIENVSNKEYNVSSLLMFSAYCDGYSINESLSAQIADEDAKTMDGALAAGKKLKGALAYEVPKDWKELEIDVDLTLLEFSNDGKIKIKLENK